MDCLPERFSVGIAFRYGRGCQVHSAWCYGQPKIPPEAGDFPIPLQIRLQVKNSVFRIVMTGMKADYDFDVSNYISSARYPPNALTDIYLPGVTCLERLASRFPFFFFFSGITEDAHIGNRGSLSFWRLRMVKSNIGH
jgi:hypothetical protein